MRPEPKGEALRWLIQAEAELQDAIRLMESERAVGMAENIVTMVKGKID